MHSSSDTEGWHSRLSICAARRCNLQFYLVVRLLHSEGNDSKFITSVYVRLVYKDNEDSSLKNCRLKFFLFVIRLWWQEVFLLC